MRLILIRNFVVVLLLKLFRRAQIVCRSFAAGGQGKLFIARESQVTHIHFCSGGSDRGEPKPTERRAYQTLPGAGSVPKKMRRRDKPAPSLNCLKREANQLRTEPVTVR